MHELLMDRGPYFPLSPGNVQNQTRILSVRREMWYKECSSVESRGFPFDQVVSNYVDEVVTKRNVPLSCRTRLKTCNFVPLGVSRMSLKYGAIMSISFAQGIFRKIC